MGQRSPRCEALMDEAEVATAVFITAANPHSEKRPAEENAEAVATLRDLVAQAGYPNFAGEGRDPEARWPAEPSGLVLGLYRENAEALGRLLRQNAIVR